MKEIKTSFLVFIIFTIITGVIYPLFVTVTGQIFFHGKANGSLIEINDKIVGSELIGQNFSKPEYFHGRPSAINYDGGNSGGSNFGPANKKLHERVSDAINSIQSEYGVSSTIPADIVLASGSGLDPHISVKSAGLQAHKIAGIRGLKVEEVNDLINKYTEKQLWGETVVNVLKINIALDEMCEK